MATVLGLALKISADATGVQQKLTPVERALKQLDTEAAKVTEVFSRFGTSSQAAANAQEQFSVRLQALRESLQAGLTSPQEYVKQFDALGVAAKEAANDIDAASKVIEANLNREERAQREFAAATAELDRLRQKGLLTEQQYGQALQRVSGDYAKATLAADKFGQSSGKAGGAGTLKFNELSGVLSALPGPLGNIAGRLSGLSSAGEGLARVFSGGLSQGLSGIGASVAGLINPFTLAVGGIAAFGAAALAVTQGLIALEDRVEKLGNTADKLGVSFEFIQTLEEAARRSGTSIEAVSAAFGRLQKNVTGVDEESKAAQSALKSIGVTAEELQALNPEEQYRLIGERLQAIRDPAERSAAAMQLFGKSGADLLPFFANIEPAAADMERFGRALTELDRRRVDDFGDGLDALGVATQGLGNALLLPFAGLGEGISFAFAEVTAGITAIIDPIGKILEPILTQLGRVIEGVGTHLGNLGRVIGAVFSPFAEVVQAVAVAFEPLLDGVLGVFQTLSDSVVVVAEWVMSFTPFGIIADNIGVFGEILGRVVRIITTAFSRVGEFVGALARKFGELVSSSPLLQRLGEAASQVFGFISQVIGDLVSSIGGFIDNLLSVAEAFLGIDDSAASAAAATEEVATQTRELSAEEKKALEERERTFQRLREEVNNAIDDSRKFGAAGKEAALAYEASIEKLKQQLSSGLIDEEQFRRSVRMAGQDFDAEIKAIEERTQLEIKVKENAQKAIEKVADQIDKAAIKAEDFGAAGDAALAQFAGRANALRLQFSAGLIDEKQLEQGVAAANREYDKQIDKIKQANAERQKQIDADQKRTEALLDEMDKTRAVQRDRAAVEREVARVRQEAAAQGFFTPEQRQQLQDLQRLQGELAEKQRAVAQGFEKGYAEAFDKTREKFDSLTVKAEQFGAAGQQAALRLAEGLNNAARLAQRGQVDEDAYQREVARQERLYEQELAQLKKVADERLKVNEAVDQMLLLQSVGGDTQRAEAKKQLIAIEQEIGRVQKEIADARKADDYEAVKAGSTRLAQLDQAAAKERDIASGAAKQREEFQKQAEKNLENQKKAQQDYAQEQQKIVDEQQKAAEAEFKRQEDRLTKLNTLGSTTIKGTDVRTQEGASLVLSLAANAQDPAMIQSRLQTKYLERIAIGIGQAASNYFNQPVAIVGYSSFGEPR